MDWMEEKITNFYNKKRMGRKRVKIKGRWRDGKIVKLRYRVVDR